MPLSNFPELAPLKLPSWAAWVAQDEDGTWWAYEAEPNQQHNGWYENEVGRLQRLVAGPPPDDWCVMLFRVGQAVTEHSSRQRMRNPLPGPD